MTIFHPGCDQFFLFDNFTPWLSTFFDNFTMRLSHKKSNKFWLTILLLFVLKLVDNFTFWQKYYNPYEGGCRLKWRNAIREGGGVKNHEICTTSFMDGPYLETREVMLYHSFSNSKQLHSRAARHLGCKVCICAPIT